ncbi:MAG: FecR family protein [Bacteroidales bacterium]|nr:FecR family protein [Bacteroidales bacterium]
MGKSLEEKYRTGKLSVEELRLLREEVAKASEDALASGMSDRWLNGTIDDSLVDQGRLDAIHSKLKGRILRRKRMNQIWKWVSVAAAVILPLCLVFSILTYKSARVQAEQLLVISTGKGEMTNITLPDGTVVKLNELSELKYSPGKFGDKKRSLSFTGEAFFEVEKKENCTFVIDADMLRVTVLGTKFNLSARLTDPFDKLFLSEGKVSILSTLSGESVTLNPNEEASLDKRTGKMMVTKVENSESTTSWVQKEIVLKGIRLDELLEILSNKYNVEFSCSNGIDTSELFTGTLPTDNLIDCSRILEYAFGVNFKISGDKVLITK